MSPSAWESAGGWLELHPTELRFLPHRINVAREPVVIELESVESTTPFRQRIFGWLPSPISNAVLLIGRDDAYRRVLIVNHRDDWVAAIESARRALGHDQGRDSPSPAVSQPSDIAAR
jgi:hypothetical protein